MNMSKGNNTDLLINLGIENAQDHSKKEELRLKEKLEKKIAEKEQRLKEKAAEEAELIDGLRYKGSSEEEKTEIQAIEQEINTAPEISTVPELDDIMSEIGFNSKLVFPLGFLDNKDYLPKPFTDNDNGENIEPEKQVPLYDPFGLFDLSFEDQSFEEEGLSQKKWVTDLDLSDFIHINKESSEKDLEIKKDSLFYLDKLAFFLPKIILRKKDFADFLTNLKESDLLLFKHLLDEIKYLDKNVFETILTFYGIPARYKVEKAVNEYVRDTSKRTERLKACLKYIKEFFEI